MKISRKLVFLIGLLFIFIPIFNFIIADTGISFAYDYFLNKLELNNTQNRVSIKYNLHENDQDINDEFNFENIKGFKNNKHQNLDNYIPTIDQLEESDNWIRSNGGDFSNKFSTYNQIDIDNINKLKLDFKLDLNNAIFKKKWMNNVETNPIYYDGLLYIVTPFRELIAIDIISKKIKWKFKSLKKIDSRGMTLWINEVNKSESCLFVPIRNGLFCINYKTGKLNSNLGQNGFIKTGIIRAAPVIWKNNVVVATVDDQKVKIISLKDGKIKDIIDIHPKNRRFKGGSPWGGISLDKKNNILFLTTGNPRPALIGTSRPGKNKNANSIIAIELNTKKILWTFQEVAHDLWDYDIASPPLLAKIKINNKYFDVVIVTTKIGNTLIFERVSGKSMYDINYSKVPLSEYLDEIVSPKQINNQIPESFMKLDLSINDFDNRLPKDKAKIINNLDEYDYGSFVPPSFSNKVIVYGLHGGAQWPGAVFDPYSQNIYLQVNQIPWLLELYITSNISFPKKMNEVYKIYESLCSSCHNKNRSGNYKTIDEKKINYVPSLIKFYNEKYDNFEYFLTKVEKKHKSKFSRKDIKKIYNLFIEWDKKIKLSEKFNTNFQWSQFLYSDNLPATKPPWGKIVSLNIINGNINWEIPSGYINEKKIGTSNFGGLTATSANLIFSTGTNDKKIVALDSKSGREVWSFQMKAAGSTAPITFMINDKQYLAVVSTGGRYHNYTKKYGELYVFSLQSE